MISILTDAPSASDDMTLMQTASKVSDAFDNGYLGRWPATCAAAGQHVAGWIAGDYPTPQVPCQIWNADGRVTSQAMCNLVEYATTLPDGSGDDRKIAWDYIYVWPDGGRTLIADDGTQVRLNDRPAPFYGSDDGMRCQTNLDSGNSFYSPPEAAEY